jgi:mannose-6-phosphate isomerase-like protein (cupin superfamily)
MITKHSGDFKWDNVDVLPYKEDGNHFKSITRQVLFCGDGDLPVEFRYFEVGPGGHSTLEKHVHQHAVMIIRGKGTVMVGDQITEIGCQDIVHIPPLTWHQFKADRDDYLGFLCIVNHDRDRPQRPGTGSDVDEICVSEQIREFIRY